VWSARLLKKGVFWDVTQCGSSKNVSEERSASIIRAKRIGELEQR
jgi:hypothetical protein